MNKKTFTSVCVMLLTITLIAPAAFFIAPQRASAAGVGCIGGLIGGLLGNASTLAAVPISNVSIQTSSGYTAATTYGTCLNDLVLMPLARMAIKVMIQHMTSSVVNFINGTGNRSGQPSFVQDLAGHLQAVGDVAALSFIGQIRQAAFSSPFGTAIAFALKANYLRQTSLAGFFAAYQSTLSKYSPNVNRFLAGDWSQGGAGAWFALTTQKNNNPFDVYQAAQNQMGSNVNQVQINRNLDLNRGSGFLSSCPSNTVAAGAACEAFSSGGCPNGEVCSADGHCPVDDGVNPQAPCTNPDGTPAKAVTPGSIIHDYTQKAVVDSGFDQAYAQLISANDIDAALGQIVNAVISQVLGGVDGLLSGSPSRPSSSRSPSLTTQLNNYTPTGTGVIESTSQTPQTKLTGLTGYMTALDTIITAANTASTSVQNLADYCAAEQASMTQALATYQNQSTSQGPDPYGIASAAIAGMQTFITNAGNTHDIAQAALTNGITPVLTKAWAASTTAATTQKFALKVQKDASLVPVPTTLSSDTAKLLTMPPSQFEVNDTISNAQVTGGAATQNFCQYSLAVSGGTTVDQMNLISTNATALKASCDPKSLMATSPTPSCSANPNPYAGSSGASSVAGWISIIAAIIQVVVYAVG